MAKPKSERTWEDVGSGKYRHAVKLGIEQDALAQADLPSTPQDVAAPPPAPATDATATDNAAPFDWNTANGAAFEDQPYQDYLKQVDEFGIPGATERAQENLGTSIGYDPTYWQDPKRVARWYNAIKATPPGATLPEFLTPELQTYIEESYKLFDYRNGGAPWTEWKYLNPADQALPLLASLPTPPTNFLWKDEGKFAADNQTAAGPNVEQVVNGQAAWSELPESQRTAIMQAPGFDVSQFDPAVRQQILSDPNFNWDALPKWQKALFDIQSSPITGLLGIDNTEKLIQAIGQSNVDLINAAATGGIQGGAMGAGNPGGIALGTTIGAVGKLSGYDPNKYFWQQGDKKLTADTQQIKEVFAGIMGFMNDAAQAFEQTVGYAWQSWDMLARFSTPVSSPEEREARDKEYKQNTLSSVFAGKSPMWKAGRVFFENSFLSRYSTNLSIGVSGFLTGENVDFLKPGEQYILGSSKKVHSPGLTESMRLARETLAADIEGGMNQEDALAKMVLEYSQYAGAPIADLIGQGIADPLNGVPSVEGKILSETIKKTSGDKLPGFVGGWDSPSEIASELKGVIRTTPVEKVAELPALTQLLGGVNKEGLITTSIIPGLYPSETLTSTKLDTTKTVGLFGAGAGKDWFRHMLTLNPEARARTGIALVVDNLGSIMSSMDVEQIEPFFNALKNGDMNLMKEISGDVVGAPEFYTALPMIRGWDKLSDIAGMWEASSINRGHLLRLADILGTEPARLVDDLSKNDSANRTFEQLRNLVTNNPDPAAKAMLADMEAGRFTVADIESIGKTFSGPDALPWHPGAYKAMIMDSIGTHAAEWSKSYFGLKPDSGAIRLAHTLKGAQSLLLLGLNPGYAINNILNNEATRLASGNFGFMSQKQIGDYMSRFGMVPERMSEGVGMIGEAIGGKSNGASDVLGEAKRAKGLLSEADKIIRSTSDKIGLAQKFAGTMEGIESSHAFTIGIKKAWAKLWTRGSGFRNMDAGLISSLRNIDPSLPDLVYRAIEGGMNKKEIEARLMGRERGVRTADLITNAAQKMGMTTSAATTLLEQAGILDVLDGYLGRATTPDKINSAFAMIDKRAMDWIDMVSGQDVRNNAGNVATRITSEGAGAVWDVLSDLNSRRTDRWMDHYFVFDDAISQIDMIPMEFSQQRNILWQEAYRRNAQEWARTNSWELSAIKGVIDGLGLDTPEAQNIISLMGENHTNWDQTYKTAQEARGNFFDTWRDRWDEPARVTEYESMKNGIDALFERAFKIERNLQEQIRDALADQVGMKYGGQAGEFTRRAYDQTLKFREEMTKRLQKFRKDADKLPYAERQASKKDFYQNTYVPMIAEAGKIMQEGIDGVRRTTGGEPPAPVAGGEPVGPVQPPEGPAPTTPQPGNTAAPIPEPAPMVAANGAEVWRIASENGMSGLDSNGNMLFGAKLDVIKFVKKWGGGEGAHVRRFDDITPEIMQQAVNNKRATEQAQAALPRILQEQVETLKNDSENLPEPKPATEEAAAKALENSNPIIEEATGEPTQFEKLLSEVQSKHIADLSPAMRDSLGYALFQMRGILEADPPPSIYDAVIRAGGIDPKFARELFGVDSKETNMPPKFWRKGGLDPYQMTRTIAGEGFPIDVNNPNDIDGVNSMLALIEQRKGHVETWQDSFKNKRVREDALFALDALSHGLDKPNQALYRDLKGIAANLLQDSNALSQNLDWARAWGAEGDITMKFDRQLSNIQEGIFNAAADGDAHQIERLTDQLTRTMADFPDAMRFDLVPTLDENGKQIPGNETWDTYMNRVWDEADSLYKQSQAEKINAQAELSMKDAENKAEAVRTREMLREQLSEIGGQSPEQIDALLSFWDANAETMGSKFGMTPEEFYNRVHGGIVRGGLGELPQTAYHGSPYKFDKFTLDHMGSGEGAQAYGWGLYFAGDKGVAEYYRKTLAGSGTLRWDYLFKGEKLVEGSPEHHAAGLVLNSGKSLAQLRKEVAGWIAEKQGVEGWDTEIAGWTRTLEVLNEATSKKDFTEKKPSGQLYKVEIPDENYLLWDRPLSEQPQAVREALAKATQLPEIEKMKADYLNSLPDEARPIAERMLSDSSYNLTNGTHDSDWQRLAELAPGIEHNIIHDIKDADLIIDNDVNRFSVAQTKGGYYYVTDGANEFGKRTKSLENAQAQLAKIQEGYTKKGEQFYLALSMRLGDKAASLALRDAGIQGIKYLDGSSRGKGDGSYNYVIFDDAAIQIKETFYQIAPINRRMSSVEVENYARALVRAGEGELRSAVQNEPNPADRVAILEAAHNLDPKMAEEVGATARLYQENKGAVTFLDDMKGLIHAYEAKDFSTFVHEPAHIFLQQLRSWEQALPEHQKQIKADLNAVSDWTKLEQKGSVWEAINGEGNHSIEERDGVFYYRGSSGEEYVFATFDEAKNRLDHEMFARGFEKYITEGIAPTTALKRVFESMKAWMLDIYKVIVGSPIDVNLTPEIRDVFDRLMAEQPRQRVSLDERARIRELQEFTGSDFFKGVKEKAARLKAENAARQANLKARTPEEIKASESTVQTWKEQAYETALSSGEAEGSAGFRLKINEAFRAQEAADVIDTPFFQKLKADAAKIKAERARSMPFDDGMAGGLLPGMREATGNLFDVQPGSGQIKRMSAPEAHSVYDVVAGKFKVDIAGAEIKPNDIVSVDGVNHGVKGFNVRGQLVTLDGRLLDPSRVRKMATQEAFFQVAAPAESPAFKRWFGESKVVDENGAPMVVYHGTQADFVEFKKEFIGTNFGADEKGFFFLSDPKQASGYATGDSVGLTAEEGGNVMPAYVSLRKPLVIDDAFLKSEGMDPLGVKEDVVSFWDNYQSLIFDWVNERKSDGVILVDNSYRPNGQPNKMVVAFKPTQIKSVNNRGTFEPTNPNILFQAADPRMPLGGVEQAGGYRADGAILDETYANQIRPLLSAMREEAAAQDNQPTFNFAKLTPEVQAGLTNYVKQVTHQDMPGTKLASVRYGEGMRDFAMLNYSKKYGFDKYILDPIVPYQFWTTRTGMNWLKRVVDRPAIYANMVRLQKFSSRYERDLPDRLKGKLKIDAPWLPEWAGGGIYIDPLKTIFPPLNYLQPFEQMARDRNSQQYEAERILQEWAADQKYSEQEIQQAQQTRKGSVWEAAFAEAQIRRKAEVANPFDFMSILLGPAMYLTTPYKLMTGKGNEISQLPITRTAQAIQTATKGSWAEPLGGLVGLLAKPEEWLRKKNNLPAFGEFGDYYIDRQLANMVADGAATTAQAQEAMIQRSGPIFDQAEERVRQELMLRAPGAGAMYAGLHGGIGDLMQALPVSAFGAGLLPEGELKYRGLKEKWNAAWDAYDNGDTQAIQKFFDDHPEYEAYLAKGKTPDERMRSLLTGQIWDSYMGMDKTTRKIVTAQLGPLFQHAFLNSETRSPESLDVETLARWSMMLGNNVPKTEQTTMPAYQIPQLEGLPQQTAGLMAQYDQAKAEQFPNISQIQNLYFASSDKDKAQFLAIYPELRGYWDWRREQITNNPELAPFLDSQVADDILSGKINPEQFGMSQDQAERLLTYYNTEYQTPILTADYYLKNASTILTDVLSDHQLTGAPLTEGAYKELRLIWAAYNMPGDSFDGWLNDIIYPTLGY